MTISETLLAEIQHESQGTRRVFERVPDDKLAWKPHEKSMSMGVLAGHIAELPLWIISTVQQKELNMAEIEYKPFNPASSKELVEKFDENLKVGIETLKGVSNEHLMEMWKMLHGENVIFELPRAAVLRSMVMNHTYHHRGQLTTYLRLNNIALPSVYGPTADER